MPTLREIETKILANLSSHVVRYAICGSLVVIVASLFAPSLGCNVTTGDILQIVLTSLLTIIVAAHETESRKSHWVRSYEYCRPLLIKLIDILEDEAAFMQFYVDRPDILRVVKPAEIAPACQNANQVVKELAYYLPVTTYKQELLRRRKEYMERFLESLPSASRLELDRWVNDHREFDSFVKQLLADLNKESERL